MTPDSISVRKNITDHSSTEISRFCNQISIRLNTSVTITVTATIPAENHMTVKTRTGNHSGCSGIIVSGPVMIFMWSGISYLRELDANWFVNVRCCRIIRNAGGWSWKRYLGWILADREIGDWSWFNLLLGLLYCSGCRCVLRLLISN